MIIIMSDNNKSKENKKSIDEMIDKYFSNTSREDFKKLLEYQLKNDKKLKIIAGNLKFEMDMNKKLMSRILDLTERNGELQKIVDEYNKPYSDSDDSELDNHYSDSE